MFPGSSVRDWRVAMRANLERGRARRSVAGKPHVGPKWLERGRGVVAPLFSPEFAAPGNATSDIVAIGSPSKASMR